MTKIITKLLDVITYALNILLVVLVIVFCLANKHSDFYNYLEPNMGIIMFLLFFLPALIQQKNGRVELKTDFKYIKYSLPILMIIVGYLFSITYASFAIYMFFILLIIIMLEFKRRKFNVMLIFFLANFAVLLGVSRLYESLNNSFPLGGSLMIFPSVIFVLFWLFLDIRTFKENALRKIEEKKYSIHLIIFFLNILVFYLLYFSNTYLHSEYLKMLYPFPVSTTITMICEVVFSGIIVVTVVLLRRVILPVLTFWFIVALRILISLGIRLMI
ncbi:hypothetical protein KAU32_03385 [bacterium]|nr:hypothetical protein [bacterium]